MKTLQKVCKTKRILIDGFNLMYKLPETDEHMHRGELAAAMKKLIRLAGEFARSAKKDITVIFDGKKLEGDPTVSEKQNGIKIEYSHDLSADFIIMQKIKKDKNPKMITVITSDREIHFFLNRFMTPCIKSEDFAEIIKEHFNPAPANIPEKDENCILTEDEISFWEKLFKSRS
ncbi:MAG: NYN domain-containing protein [Spirochaetes bacterium]|nr:NYN domain-containing protein [Spirochaetota bacterium]